MVKTKPLLPSLREKKRYLAFELISEDRITEPEIVENSIKDSMHDFIGRLGVEKAGLIFLSDKWDKINQKGLVRVNNKYVDHLKASLALVKKVNGQKVIVRSLGVSGILKKAHAKYIAK